MLARALPQRDTIGAVPGDPAANVALINRFYEAFARRDGETMAACYTADAHFHDPVFQDLHGAEIGAMWRMLCGRATDLEIVHSQVEADGERGSAHWEADYTFSTGRAVHNPIDAAFRFEGGLIADHRDEFDLYAWARQALGPIGVLLGWSPPVRSKIRAQAREGLDEFMAGSPPASSESA
jgi:ketosteroid isomerase-like protein